MRNSCRTGSDAVGRIAARALSAWKSGNLTNLESQRTQALDLALRTTSDSFVMEKSEVLEGAIESLRHTRQEQVRAAVLVLEHLAYSGANSITH